MLFITAQDLPTKEWKDENGNWNKEYCKINEVSVPFNEQLQMKPMWAIPYTNFRETLCSMILTAPNYPIMLYVFETEDYIKIDKLKHYENIKNGDYKNLPIEDKNLEEKYCEYCLNIETLKEPLFQSNISAILEVNKTGMNIGSLFLYDNMRLHPDVQRAIVDAIRSVPKPDYSSIQEQLKSEDFKNIEARTLLNVSWLLYKFTILPIIINSIKIWDLENKKAKLGFNLSSIESCVNSVFRMIKINNEFSKWSHNDCSIEMYNQLYNSMKNCIIENEDCLSTLFEYRMDGKKYRAKDLCPCGSNKKFKKCCGKFSGITSF